MDTLLALFPLNMVLFPGVTLPLHIFEQRYRQMINRCVQLEQPFGVVLIRDGAPQGGPVAEPHEVGTTAVIQNVLRFPDGRMLISAIGERRFRITSIIQREPYMVGAVEYLPEDDSPATAAMAEQIKVLYVRHRDALTHATGIAQQMDELPEDPLALSYQLSAQFHVLDDSKQQLLEADLEDRLAAIVDALEREVQLLPAPPNDPLPSGNGPWTLN